MIEFFGRRHQMIEKKILFYGQVLSCSCFRHTECLKVLLISPPRPEAGNTNWGRLGRFDNAWGDSTWRLAWPSAWAFSMCRLGRPSARALSTCKLGRPSELIIRYVTVRYAPCYVAAPKNYRPTSTCVKIILAGAFDVEARSAVSLGLLDVEGRSADSSVFFCVFAQSSPSVGIFGQRTGRWYFLQSSPSTKILTNGLDRAFWGGLRAKSIRTEFLIFGPRKNANHDLYLDGRPPGRRRTHKNEQICFPKHPPKNKNLNGMVDFSLFL